MKDYHQIQSFGGVIDVLEAVGATYAIWGGMAVIAHAESRFTRDMDILLSPTNFYAPQFVRRLKETHYHVDEIAVNRALTGGGFFNVIHLYYHVKSDFYIPQEPILKAMIAERVYLRFDEMRQAAYVTPTSLVIAKLRAYDDSQSTRHLEDIASVIRIQKANLDQNKIETTAARLGLLDQWRRLQEENKK